jgi:hypothetical protein
MKVVRKTEEGRGQEARLRDGKVGGCFPSLLSYTNKTKKQNACPQKCHFFFCCVKAEAFPAPSCWWLSSMRPHTAVGAVPGWPGPAGAAGGSGGGDTEFKKVRYKTARKEISIDFLRTLFHLPLAEAAKNVGTPPPPPPLPSPPLLPNPPNMLPCHLSHHAFVWG